MRPLLALLALLAVGCVQKISIVSDPVGAQVRMGQRDWGTTPTTVTLWSVPFRPHVARVTFPGYRAVDVDLGPDRRPAARLVDLVLLRPGRALGWVPAGSHEVILVRRHGPAGSWSAEEVQE